ncbi:hypothetical protein [Curtobacterium sp. MCSS17_008]|uniref:hypothetical protein n=1 Tax=Curtobacterium sp. MCSS17_008 TaxID=2175647 RepID=UPI0011B81C01|nr:hypothetical protein [Curtobacterium sp. MCSS17_008]
MTTRRQIARARARVALAARTGEDLPNSVHQLAAMDFADADHTATTGRGREDRQRPQRGDLATLLGVHAAGNDFGRSRELEHPRDGQGLEHRDEQAILESLPWTHEQYEAARSAVARGELDALERSVRRSAMNAAITYKEVSDRLEVGTARILARLASGDLFAFVSDDEMLFPTWQFTNDPDRPVLNQLSTLIEAFDDDMHPASILGFMTTPHSSTRIDGIPITPVEWLARGRGVQPLVEILGVRRLM